MKITKKIVALMLVAGMVMSGCGGKKEAGLSAEEVLQKSNEKQKEITAVDGEMSMKMSMAVEGEAMDVDMDVKVKAKDATSEKMTMWMEGTMNMLGQEMPMKMYYKDGYQYTEAMGQKVKMAMDYTEMSGMANQNSALAEVPMDAYKTLEMKNVDSGYELTYVADGAKVTELVESLLGTTMGEGLSFSEMTVKDISGTTVVDKDFKILNMTMKFDFTMVEAGQSMDCSLDMSMKYNAFGDDVTVEEPADLDEYVDMSEMTEGLEDIDTEALEEGLEDIDLEGLEEELENIDLEGVEDLGL